MHVLPHSLHFSLDVSPRPLSPHTLRPVCTPCSFTLCHVKPWHALFLLPRALFLSCFPPYLLAISQGWARFPFVGLEPWHWLQVVACSEVSACDLWGGRGQSSWLKVWYTAGIQEMIMQVKSPFLVKTRVVFLFYCRCLGEQPQCPRGMWPKVRKAWYQVTFPVPQIITWCRSPPAALTPTARGWLPSRLTGASRSGTWRHRPRCSPSPSEEAGQRAATARWAGFTPSWIWPVHLQLPSWCGHGASPAVAHCAATRRLEMENGKGTGNQGGTTPVGPLHSSLQVASFQRRERLSQPLYASCHTVLLYFSRFCDNVLFLVFVFMSILFVWKVL